MLEKDIEKYFVKVVKEMGGRAFKFVSPSNRGVSDRVVCLPEGIVWFVEIKRPGGKLTPLQKLFAAEVQALGHRYTCLWTYEDVNKWRKDNENI